MGRQYNKVEKRKRRLAYLKRKQRLAKANVAAKIKPAPQTEAAAQA